MTLVRSYITHSYSIRQLVTKVIVYKNKILEHIPYEIINHNGKLFNIIVNKVPTFNEIFSLKGYANLLYGGVNKLNLILFGEKHEIIFSNNISIRERI